MKNLYHTPTVVAVGLFLFSAVGSSAQDWPQWRGAQRDAQVSGFTAPAAWPSELKQEWKIKVGEGVATPALVGDKLYVFARQDGREVTSCLKADTGERIWQAGYDSLGATGPASRFSGPRSSPAVAQGKVVTCGVRGILSCLDAASGEVLWRKDDFSGAWPRFFTSASPVIVDGLCVAQLGGPDNGGIVAYDLKSGEVKWQWKGDGPAYASPAVCTVGGAKVIVALTSSQMVGVRAADGKLAWQTPFEPQRRAYNAATPIVDGDTIIYTGAGRGTRAVKIVPSGDDYSLEEVWSNPDTAVQFNTPVLKDGLVFGLTSGGDFFCLNQQTGETTWTKATGQRGGYGSILNVGPVLLALTPESQLIVLEPSEKAYTELASLKVADTPTYAYPVVFGKRLYVKDQDALTLWTIP